MGKAHVVRTTLSFVENARQVRVAFTVRIGSEIDGRTIHSTMQLDCKPVTVLKCLERDLENEVDVNKCHEKSAELEEVSSWNGFFESFTKVNLAPHPKIKYLLVLPVSKHCPNRVLEIRQTYERYVEHEDVQAAIWIPIKCTPDVMVIPPDVLKVIIDSTVIRFYVRDRFFCFSRAVLEGNVSKLTQTNIQHIFKVAKSNVLNDERVHIIQMFSFKFQKFIIQMLHHVHLKGISVDVYCLCKSNDDSTQIHPKYSQLPCLVSKWIKFYDEYRTLASSSYVNVNLVRLALVLVVHKIYFKTIISTKQPHEEHEMIVNDNDINIEFYVTWEVSDFINNARLGMEEMPLNKENKASCCIL
ncbi:hypothetical protein AVEN_140054-1 [Araneus ventricosus]|uniref:Uncharacterized protein n=1 Tax=Araneus ventricosus TaxID=182803 RepID=A0A4Y2LFV9_ARAVE|nr:hypothetical protein AVEN_140054-1 [Araneus ventricosus]